LNFSAVDKSGLWITLKASDIRKFPPAQRESCSRESPATNHQHRQPWPAAGEAE
jgi:hypothetical protein